MVEDLGLAALGRGDEVLLEDLKDVLADLAELGLDLLTVLLDQADLGLVALALLLLLDGGDDAPRGTASANDVLVGDGQKVPLLDGQLLVGGGDSLHVLDHLCVGGQQAHAVVFIQAFTYPHSARPAQRASQGRRSSRSSLWRLFGFL